jgi:predicted  nucleic acid-binding Zn-ribbon protein
MAEQHPNLMAAKHVLLDLVQALDAAITVGNRQIEAVAAMQRAIEEQKAAEQKATEAKKVLGELTAKVSALSTEAQVIESRVAAADKNLQALRDEEGHLRAKITEYREYIAKL